MKESDLAQHTLLEISQMIRSGETSSLELVNLLLKRIRDTEGKIKAYVTVCDKTARKLAEDSDKEENSKRNKMRPPLAGIPISIKDNFETRGIRTTCGSKILSDYIPKNDATIVARLRSAGMIILGKLNTHEFALGGLTPPTRNPWNLGRIALGSSGGSGAAVSAASALAATGSDTGGSIRGPAAVCGVVGLKPTYGRVSRHGVFPASWSLDHVGPISRRVEDAAVLLTLMGGEDRLDPTTSDRRVPNFVSQSNRFPKKFRIGIPKNHFFENCDKRIKKAVHRGIDVIAGLGSSTIDFVFAEPSKMLAARLAIESCEAAAYHARWLSTKPNKYNADVRISLEESSLIPAVYYIQALRYRQKAMIEARQLFKRIDIMITPTVVMLAPKVGEIVSDDTIMQCTGPFNFLGLPALSVPCGFADGLPIGMQIVGNLFDEARVLAVGRAYEEVTRYYLRTPTIS